MNGRPRRVRWWWWLAGACLLGLGCGTLVYTNPFPVLDGVTRFKLWRAGVHSEYAEVDGYRIHFFEAAPPDGTRGTPLVLIHGLGARGEEWSAMMPALAAAGFHVYAPDLLGYGRSPKPDADYSIALQEKTVADFIESRGLAHTDVAGWSMGGWVALKLTLDHPDRVDRLIVFDAAGIYFHPTYDGSLFTPTDGAGLARLSAMLTPHPRPLPGFIERAAIVRLQANRWVLERSVSAMEGGRDLLDFRLHTIAKPVLIVWGAEDRLIPPAVGETMHHAIPGSSMLLIEDCGHLAPAECSAPALRETTRFLRAQPPLSGEEKTVPNR